ncbi:unnamed protein product [Oncorhynchus mykiss]|uniref:J domain-containing protein n=1 Tax=Oncorhynchus mykiss TaxID=8022 RepID=A0A060Z3A5_ONCMY|nr:unnamed protein product [Oncorhynchus mykiss]
MHCFCVRCQSHVSQGAIQPADGPKTGESRGEGREIGNAYAVLSNPDKRKQYDLTGAEEPTSPGHAHSQGFDFHRGFEADITPEDLFNMFFGGGFPSSAAHTFTNGRARYSQQTDQRRERAEERGEGGFSMFIQLIPIVVLILVSILSQLMVSTPPYQPLLQTVHGADGETADGEPACGLLRQQRLQDRVQGLQSAED